MDRTTLEWQSNPEKYQKKIQKKGSTLSEWKKAHKDFMTDNGHPTFLEKVLSYAILEHFAVFIYALQAILLFYSMPLAIVQSQLEYASKYYRIKQMKERGALECTHR